MNAPVLPRPLAARAGRPLAPSLERWRVRLYLSVLLLDIVLLLLAFGAVEQWYIGPKFGRSALLEAQLLLPLYLTLALYQRVYSVTALQSWRYGAARALAALVISATLLIFITFYAKSTASFSRVVFTGGIVLSAVLIVISRKLLDMWIKRSWGPSVINLLHIDAGGPEVPIRHAIRVDARLHGIVPDPADPDALDRLGRYLLNMDRVIVSCPFDDRAPWAQVLRAAGVRGELVTDRLGELKPIGLAVEDGWRSLIVSTGPLGMRQRVMKRGFDAALALMGLLVLSPIILAAALAIKIEDSGPLLFVQQRLGRGNRYFRMLKFRSMRVAQADQSGARSASRGDDRVTRVGRFIRRTSIDELPQLINVLKGDMSLVGPRPHAIGSHAGAKLFWEVDGTYWNRHTLKPGVTGLAQIRGYRGATDDEVDLTNRLEADLEYIRDWSLLGDAVIVLRTLGVLVHARAFLRLVALRHAERSADSA